MTGSISPERREQLIRAARSGSLRRLAQRGYIADRDIAHAVDAVLAGLGITITEPEEKQHG